MYANCSTTAQRGALDWRHKFREAVEPVYDELYESVKSGREAEIAIEAGRKPDYREKLEAEMVASADDRSHFAFVDDLFCLAYGVKKMETDEGKDFVLGKLRNSWNKMMPEAQEMLADKYAAIKQVFGD